MLKRVALSVVALFAICIGVRAQESASSGITGQVVDSSKAGVPGATITVTNLATNAQRITQTDSEGRFALPNLPPATYSVRVELGFQTTELKDLMLRNGEIARPILTLGVAGVSETISVQPESPLLQSTNRQSADHHAEADRRPARGRPQSAGVRLALCRCDTAGFQSRHAVRRRRKQPQPVRHGRGRTRQLDQLRDRWRATCDRSASTICRSIRRSTLSRK